MSIDWKEMARMTRLRDVSDMPQATPRVPTCRKCGNDSAGAGMVYCSTHRADFTEQQLVDAGEYHGNWRVGRNGLGNAIWERDR